jgi:hypothetical protein
MKSEKGGNDCFFHFFSSWVDYVSNMANKSAKRLASENARVLSTLRVGVFVTIPAFIVLRGWMYYSTLTMWHIITFTLTAGIELLLYRQLLSMARVVYDTEGKNIVSAGDDLLQEGLTSYMFDVIYVTWMVHTGVALVSDAFWWMYLVIPVFAAYKIIQLIMSARGMMNSGGAEQPPQPEMSKTQLKKQKKIQKHA